MPRSSKLCLSFKFPHKNPVSNSVLPHTFNRPKNVLWAVQILTVACPPPPFAQISSPALCCRKSSTFVFPLNKRDQAPHSHKVTCKEKSNENHGRSLSCGAPRAVVRLQRNSTIQLTVDSWQWAVDSAVSVLGHTAHVAHTRHPTTRQQQCTE